jgi:type IV pilus assembly protein PilN
MRITLNLATRPFADLGPAIKRLRIAMGAMAVVSIGLGFGLHLVHSKAQQARARDHSLDGAIARITREREGYTELMRQPQNAQVLALSVELNQLFDQKIFSWTLAMEDLETVLPGGVQVTSIEPVPDKEGNVTLHLRVKGPRDREVELVSNLEHSRRFLSPRIVGENAEASEGPNQQDLQPVSASNPFNFDLLAEYNPATLGELTAAEKTGAGKAHAEATPEKLHAPARPVPAAARSGMQSPARSLRPRHPFYSAPGNGPARPSPSRPIRNQGGPQ